MQNKNIGSYVDDYLQRGFGSMNKNDFEVFIFSWLTSFGACQDKTDYAISCELKIPESKVKRLRYEAGLRYGTANESDYWKQLRKALKSAQYRSTGNGGLRLSIPDKQLRLFLKDQLQHDNRFFDSSFAENVVVLDVEDFLYLADNFFSEADKAELIAQAKKASKGATLPKSTGEIIKTCSVSVAKSFLKRFINDSVVDELCSAIFL